MVLFCDLINMYNCIISASPRKKDWMMSACREYIMQMENQALILDKEALLLLPGWIWERREAGVGMKA